ncbi:MAG: YncE family protein [Steroidobacteraceae bacterium]
MNRKHSILRLALTVPLLCLSGWAVTAAHAAVPQSRLPLEPYETVPLPGHLGRIDHFDGQGRMLYFSLVGGNGVGVENWFDGRLVHFIPGVPAPQGEVYTPGFNEIFSASSAGKVYIFDASTYRLKKTIDFGTDADDEVWDPVHHEVLVGFGEDDGGVAAIDPATNSRVGKVLRTGGHPERFSIELHGPMMYVNCPDAGMVVEAIDRNTGQLTKWPLPAGLRGNYAMALDEADHRLFTVTRKIPMLIVFDTQSGKVVSVVPGIAGEADDAFYDASRKRIYIIGGQGFVSVVQQMTPDRYGLIANVPSKVGARTGYWNAHMDRLYIGVQAEGDAPAEVMGFEAEDY